MGVINFMKKYVYFLPISVLFLFSSVMQLLIAAEKPPLASSDLSSNMSQLKVSDSSGSNLSSSSSTSYAKKITSEEYVRLFCEYCKKDEGQLITSLLSTNQSLAFSLSEEDAVEAFCWAIEGNRYHVVEAIINNKDALRYLIKGKCFRREFCSALQMIFHTLKDQTNMVKVLLTNQNILEIVLLNKDCGLIVGSLQRLKFDQIKLFILYLFMHIVWVYDDLNCRVKEEKNYSSILQLLRSIIVIFLTNKDVLSDVVFGKKGLMQRLLDNLSADQSGQSSGMLLTITYRLYVMANEFIRWSCDDTPVRTMLLKIVRTLDANEHFKKAFKRYLNSCDKKSSYPEKSSDVASDADDKTYANESDSDTDSDNY